MKFTKISLFFSILFVFTFITASQADTVDSYIKTTMQKEKIPGISIVVLKNGKIIKAKGYGLANIELNVPATTETRYQSGSVGKQFTATLVMMLVEQGKLKLDDKISRYLKNTPPSWKNITIRHLLTQTSGIKDYYSAHLFNYRLDYTNKQLLKKLESLPLEFQPGSKWSYSNSGYVLLGYIIQDITGKFYGDLLEDKIFKPLNMQSHVISEADIVPNRAAGYRLVKGEVKNQEYVAPIFNTTADGALYVTVLDLAKWDAALYTDKLLTNTDLASMWTPIILKNGKPYPYGYGWYINNVNNHRVIEHEGEWQGFETVISRYIDDKLTVVVLANLVDATPIIIAHHIAGLYDPALMPKEEKTT